MTVAANLPAEPALYVEVAAALSDAGAHAQALDLLRRALVLDPKSLDALRAAGRAAFAVGQYRQARAFLARYIRAAPGGNPEESALLETATWILSVDASAARLSNAERANRAARAFAIADARARCLEAASGQITPEHPAAALVGRLAAARGRATPARLRRDPDDIGTIFELALEAERIAAEHCGPPRDAADVALLTLAKTAREDADAGQ